MCCSVILCPSLCVLQCNTMPLTVCVAVYRGEVEFMKLQDWHQELAVLIDEVCTQENQVLARPPAETDEGRHGAVPQCLSPLLLCLSASLHCCCASVALSTAVVPQCLSPLLLCLSASVHCCCASVPLSTAAVPQCLSPLPQCLSASLHCCCASVHCCCCRD